MNIKTSKKKGIISAYNLLCFLIILFPILPYWFKLGGTNVSYIICTIICVIIFFMVNAKIPLYINVPMLLIGQGVFIRLIQLFWTGNIKTLLFYFVTTVVLLSAMLEVINSQSKFIGLINALVYTCGFVSFWGFIEEVTHFNIFSLLNTGNDALNYNALRFGLLRIISFSSHAIAYCLYLTMMLCLILYSMQFCRTKRELKIKQLIYIMAVLNAILTLSRSSLILMIISQIFLFYVTSGSRKFIIKAIKVIVIGGLAVAILSMISNKVLNSVKMFLYMLLAVFNDSYSSKISSVFGGDNLSGVGNRLDLYNWVWQELQGHILLGKGFGAEFSHQYTFKVGPYYAVDVKKSIEVQYLSTLYYFGIVGLVSQVIAYCGTIMLCLKNKLSKANWESKLSFSFVAAVALITCYLEYFAVSQGTDREIFVLLIDLLIVYKVNKKFEKGM